MLFATAAGSISAITSCNTNIRKFLKPSSTIMEYANKVANGDLSQGIPDNVYMGRLAIVKVGFNRMLLELQSVTTAIRNTGDQLG